MFINLEGPGGHSPRLGERVEFLIGASLMGCEIEEGFTAEMTFPTGQKEMVFVAGSPDDPKTCKVYMSYQVYGWK